MKSQIHFNSDVGEGLNIETHLLPYLNSCSIACGGHTGDIRTMTKVIELANRHGVKVGAHPSYPDKKNFGRITMNLSAAALFASLNQQIRVLQNALMQSKTRLHHIKPHGALYNDAGRDEKIASVIIEVMKGIDTPLKLYVPYGSVIASMAANEGVPIKYEGFADRNYNDDLSLVSRSRSEAIITNEEDILHHVKRMVSENRVKTMGGNLVKIEAETFCIHGDNPNAQNILKYLSENL